MSLFSGSNSIAKVYSGSSEIQKVYAGANEVWSASSPPGEVDVFTDLNPITTTAKWPNTSNVTGQVATSGSIRISTTGAGSTLCATAAITVTAGKTLRLQFTGTTATDTSYTRIIRVGSSLYGSDLYSNSITAANWLAGFDVSFANASATQVYITFGSVPSINAQTGMTDITLSELP